MSASPLLVQKVCRELTASGRLVESGFDALRSLVIPPHASADQVAAAMAAGQADKRAPGLLVQQRGSLAHQIGQEQQAVGALLIQTLTTTMYARNVSADIAPVPKALVIIAVCLLQSEVSRRWFARVFRGGKAS